MDQQYGEFVGVDKVYTFPVMKDDEENYIAGTPEYLAPAAEISSEAKTDNNTTYYDNKAGNNYVSEAATEIKITLSNTPAKRMAEILGKYYDASTGRVYDDGEPNPPDTGLMFRYNMGKAGFRYYCYLKGTFAGGAEEATSKGEKVDAKTYEVTFTALNTTHEWLLNGQSKSLKRIFGDTADPAFNPDGWYNKAQTPDTTTKPAELTMTSVPADNATNIALDSSIVLTFNNKISEYNATMIKNDFTPVAATNSFDSDGKILTINPNEDLAANSVYAVILTGIKDIYGQALEDQVINFTTVSA